MKPWCASFTGVSSSKTPTTWSSSAVRAPARPTSPRRLACRRLNTIARKVRFFGTVDLVNALEQEKAQGRSGQIADRLMRCDLVMLDSCEVGNYVELPDFDTGFAWLPADSSSGYST